MPRKQYKKKKSYTRKRSRKSRRKPFKSSLTKKQQAMFNHLMSGGTLEEE